MSDPKSDRAVESKAFDGARTQSVRKHTAFRTMITNRIGAATREAEIAAIKRVADAMQDAWDDWVGDVGRAPDFLTVHADGHVSADLAASLFAESVAERLRKAP